MKPSIPAFLLLGACAGGAGCSTPAALAPVHLVGRFDASDPAGPRFSFAGSRLLTRFEGTALRVRLAEAGPNQYSVRVDGDERPVLKTESGTKVYTLVDGLAAGAHDLVLTRRTESFFGITQWLGFEGASLVPTPPPYRRFIEIVGDSISNGYGVLGDGPTCAFVPDTESEPDAYGALAAAALHAGHATIAYSGKGIFQNYGHTDEPLVPAVYTQTFGDAPGTPWDFARGYQPDVIVVNLGTNDYWAGDPGDGFSKAYDAFVVVLRARHPSAWIVVALAPMLSDAEPAGKLARTSARTRLQGVVAAARARGEARVDFLELDEQREEDGLGCDHHPGRVTQKKAAAQLEAKIRALTGWKD